MFGYLTLRLNMYVRTIAYMAGKPLVQLRLLSSSEGAMRLRVFAANG